MRVLSAQDVLSTEDCTLPGCGFTALPGELYCVGHKHRNETTAHCEACSWEFTGRKERVELLLSTHRRAEHPELYEKPPPAKGSRCHGGIYVPPSRPRDVKSEEFERFEEALRIVVTTPKENVMPMRVDPDRPRLDEYVELFRAFHGETGRWPLPSDGRKHTSLPSPEMVIAYAGGWQAVWDELEAGPVPQGRAAQRYKGTGPYADTPVVEAQAEPDQTLDEHGPEPGVRTLTEIAEDLEACHDTIQHHRNVIANLEEMRFRLLVEIHEHPALEER